MAEVNVERWKPHLEAAKKQGMSLAQYARENGVSRHTLYMTSMELRRIGQAAPSKAKPGRKPKLQKKTMAQMGESPASAFVPVRLADESSELPILFVRLPNGVELHIDAAAASYCAAVITALAGLPCSP